MQKSRFTFNQSISISRDYYENSKNKQQALYDMLHIDDYKKFYEKSNAEAWIRKNKEE